ncbi:hypothetical protein EVAR_94450_1 [Eumeta japonica]|uniref:Uncharacterized protein n=1 Tax=Eumeta variegata TaxID=151549 RepID=A0A4C1ZL80_EUMVA|nr:hypothetical protein EVAR_94450_1 [Eumeta japonica]
MNRRVWYDTGLAERSQLRRRMRTRRASIECGVKKEGSGNIIPAHYCVIRRQFRAVVSCVVLYTHLRPTYLQTPPGSGGAGGYFDRYDSPPRPLEVERSAVTAIWCGFP